MSRSRTIRRLTKKRKVELQRIVADAITLDALLFGTETAPIDEHLEQRRELIRRFRELMREFNAQNPAKLRDYLYAAYEKYNLDTDGQSTVMSLIWDIETLKELERDETHPRSHR